jgi:hypothetical protein
MAGKGTLRVVLCFGLMGLSVGLLVVFAMFMNAFLASQTKPPEVTLDQKQRAFMATARDEWSNKQMELDDVLGRIAVVQTRSGDADGARQTTDKVQLLNKNIISSNAVADVLYNKISPTETSKETIVAVIARAKGLANGIQDPLFKADTLRRVAEYEEKVDAEAAKKTLHDAAQAALTAAPPPEKPGPFNTWTLLWPAGLTVFGLVFGAALYGVFGGAAAAPAPAPAPVKSKGKAAAEEEEEEEEEDEEEEEEQEKEGVELVGQAPAPAAAEPIAEEPVAPPPPAPAPAPARAPTRAVPPAAPQPAMAQAPAGMSAEDKKTMLAKQAQATMLAKQAQATMLAKQASKPTQIAPEDQKLA